MSAIEPSDDARMIGGFKNTREILQDAPKYSTNREELGQLVDDSNGSSVRGLLSLKDILVGDPSRVSDGKIEKYRIR